MQSIHPTQLDTNVVAKGSVGSGTVTFSAAASLTQSLTVTGNLTTATSNWPATGNYADMLLKITNGGSATITWPTITWVKSDGTTQSTPTRVLQSSGTDWVIIWSTDGGTTLYARFV